MEVKREKQTDWSGTISGLAGMNNISENTEIDENSPKYKKWREEEKKILIPSDARIEKIKIETTNNGKQKRRRSRSLSTTSKNKGENIENNSIREEQEDVKIDANKQKEPKSINGREFGE